MSRDRLEILGLSVMTVSIPITWLTGFFGIVVCLVGVVVFWVGWLERHERSGRARSPTPPRGIISDYESNELRQDSRVRFCPACGAVVLRPGAKFCDECGKPLAAPF